MKQGFTAVLAVLGIFGILFGIFFLPELWLGLTIISAGGSMVSLGLGISQKSFFGYGMFFCCLVLCIVFANNYHDFGLFTKII